MPTSDISFAEAFFEMNAWFRSALDRGLWDERIDRAVAQWSCPSDPFTIDLQRAIHWGTKLAIWHKATGWAEPRWRKFVQGIARGAAGSAEAKSDLLEELMDLFVSTATGDFRCDLEQILDASTMQHTQTRLIELARDISPLAEVGPVD